MKKTHLINVSFILFFFLQMIQTYSQSYKVVYEYDDAGNRVRRHVVYMFMMNDSLSSDSLQNASLATDSLLNDSILSEATLNDNIPNDSSAKINPNQNNQNSFTENIGNYNMLVFPNPTKGKILLKITGKERLGDTHLFVYSESGVELYKRDNFSNETIVDFSGYTVGTYFLKVQIAKSNKTIKIVKEQ